MELKQRIPVTRAKRLMTKFTSSPVLPVLGWTKVVESFVLASPALWKWVVYATLVTVTWVYADAIQEAAEDAVNEGDSE